ncbi:MAG: site-specific integrase, partial [Bacteroidia bacterium]|nr:site-specific integrase [Bacteroidia bacterium]
EVGPYIKSYIKRITEEGNLAQGTIQGFDQLLSRWSDYKEGYGKSFDDLNIDVLKGFQSHMKTYGYSQSQREKIQRKLVTILRYAENADKIRVNSDYKLKYWKVGVTNDSVKIVMSDEEIKKIRDHDFCTESEYDGIRDRWIIGFAVGQRYSDFKNISKENIREIQGKKFIEVVQQKTGKIVNIPLYDDVQKIFNKYNGYPPVYRSQKFNECIKEVAYKVGIDNTVTKILQMSPNEKKISQHPKYELVCSHICRRSFATNGILKGLSMAYLMEITGHKKPQTFMQYINLDKTHIPVNLPKGNSIFE